MPSVELETVLKVLCTEYEEAQRQLKEIDSRIGATITEPLQDLSAAGDVEGLQDLVQMLPPFAGSTRFVYAAICEVVSKQTADAGVSIPYR